MSEQSFFTLGLKQELLDNLTSIGYEKMTEIQSKALPFILKNNDVIAKAKTGSGKTLAFGIGIISAINVKNLSVQALVLCPTRELAEQVAKEIRKIARSTQNIKLVTLCGGVPMRSQLSSLNYGAHIAVGTPGRIQAHLDKGSLNLKSLKVLVLDEADRMLDMGFYDDIKKIIEITPSNRQTLLFSATFPDAIKEISTQFQKNPIAASVESIHSQSIIKQVFFKTPKGTKLNSLIKVLDYYQPKTTIVFCNTKIACKDVAEYLNSSGFHAIDIHGDLEQRERTEALIQFSNDSCSILVATDVAARGLDVKDVKAVISFDLAHDKEVHIHRIGRTGRAGKDGLAISFYNENELNKLEEIEEHQKSQICHENLDSLIIKKEFEHKPPMTTLCIDGGRKQKIRAGDVLGALTKEMGIAGECVGKIDILEFQTYVAIKREFANKAFNELKNGKIKGKNFRIWKL